MKKFLCIFPILIISGLACTRPDDEPMRSLVIEAWIDSDDFPVAILTEAFNPETSSNVSDLMVRWGRVVISDGEDSVVLTGSVSKEFFPPFRYFNYRMEGKPGRTYTVTADYQGMHLEATSTMLRPTPIDSVIIKPIEGEDSIRNATLYFTAPSDCPAYYYLKVKRNIDHVVTQPGLGMFSTTEVLEPGKKVSIPVFNPKNSVDSIVYISNLIVGENIEVSLCRVEKDVYEFWRDYDNYTMFGVSQFVSGQGSVKGNVSGGFGIFSVQAVSRVNIDVE